MDYLQCDWDGEAVIQVVSDIHLEFKKALAAMPEIPVRSHVLCLLGDIGYPFQESYKDFLLSQSKRFKHIIVIAGNHEFYSPDENNTKTMEEILHQLHLTCEEIENVHFLYRSHLELECLPNIRFIGATLWSNIPNEHKYDVADFCNDYEYIFTACSSNDLVSFLPQDTPMIGGKGISIRNLSVAEQNQLHVADLEFIKKQISIAKDLNQTAVILTHHAPTDKNTIPESEDWVPLRYINFSNLEDFFKDPVRVWAFGHTHRTSYSVFEKCIVASNQLGYVKEHDENFQADFTLSFEPI